MGNARMGQQTAMLGLKIAAGIVGTAAVSLVIGMLAVGMSDRNRMMGYGYGGGYGGYGMMPWI
jgi:fucose permease